MSSRASITNHFIPPEKHHSPILAKAAKGSQFLLQELGKKVRESEPVENVKIFVHSAAEEVAKIQEIFSDENRRKKLRALLSHFVNSKINARLLDDDDNDDDDDDDAEALDINLLPSSTPQDADGVSIPLRMFDVDSMSMVDTYNLSEDDQYCMLSHSWKGKEVDFNHFSRAQRQAKQSGCYKDDVNAVLDQCTKDVGNAAESLWNLARSSNVSVPIRDILSNSLAATKARNTYARAKREYHAADAAYQQSMQEKHYYQDIMRLFNRNEELQSMERQTKEAKKRLNDAQGKLKKAHEEYKKQTKEDPPRKLSCAITDMLEALQRSRSARKLEKSILHAKDIFDKKFPTTTEGRRYIWLDTCCIDKTNHSELTTSLAQMGDWYANADFTLVHLDTPIDDRDWIDELDLSMGNKPEQRADPSLLKKFEKIEDWKPTWATRGWTLQELVLSKTTFFVNADWGELSREVEKYGRYYTFCPFINLYIGNRKRLNTEACWRVVNMGVAPKVKQRPRDHFMLFLTPLQDVGEEIIAILKRLHFQVPRHLDNDTAKVRISMAVRDTIRYLGGRFEGDESDTVNGQLEDSEKHSALETFEKFREALPDARNKGRPEQQMKMVIDSLLATLADETSGEIKEDRNIIAKFSKVAHLKSWSEGTKRVNFSAQSVMKLASDRVCTVPTDKAYSLMGILGVRFPAFPAEGLVKALSRLLDEVVITSNDISVFNWVGKHNGSPIRGRSLYPSNIEAFRTDVANSQGQFNVGQELVSLFRQARLKDSMIAKEVNGVLESTTEYIRNDRADGEILVELDRLVESVRNTDLKTLRRKFDSLNWLTELKNAMTSAPNENFQVTVKKPHEEASPVAEQEERKRRSKRQRIVAKYRKWRGKERPEEKSEEAKQTGHVMEEEQPAQHEKINEVRNWIHKVNSKLRENPQSQGDGSSESPITESHGHQAWKDKEPQQSEQSTQQVDQKDDLAGLDRILVCPNPIVVDSSGIRGVFDIQRVVVTMLEPGKLRSKIKHASYNEKIDGWCIISTGFALTMVAFSCESHILEQQLNVAELVNEIIQGDVDATEKEPTKPDEALNFAESHQRWLQEIGQVDPKQKKPKDHDQTPQQARVMRMIRFVTDDNLHGIAGEWVLARVSGAPGAKWFLCRLELGTGNGFYARRIATDEFDFANAVPEKGLVEYWQKYLHNVKETSCRILLHRLKSQAAKESANRLNGDDHGEQQLNNGEARIADKMHDLSDEEEDQSDEEDQESTTESQGFVRRLARNVRWAGLKASGFISEDRADRLHKRREKKFMRGIPVYLQAAVDFLHNNETLLPFMFHSGQDVHFV